MKFAYLIMAHKNEEQLKKLLHELDWKENDIYLHIDRKVNFNIEEIIKSIKKANITVYSKYKVYWGDISQTKCQMFLLQKAVKNYHDYYHLISGQDLPIKSHNEIMEYFSKNRGVQFVHFENFPLFTNERSRFYHLWWPWIVRCNLKEIKKTLILFEEFSIWLQKLFHVRRKLYRGANWYSITHKLADEFVKSKQKMIRVVSKSKNSDECILQTFLMRYSKNIYCLFDGNDDYTKVNSRLIDWKRGGPYVWKSKDYNELIESDCMFARKFDASIDNDIITKIIESNINR